MLLLLQRVVVCGPPPTLPVLLVLLLLSLVNGQEQDVVGHGAACIRTDDRGDLHINAAQEGSIYLGSNSSAPTATRMQDVVAPEFRSAAQVVINNGATVILQHGSRQKGRLMAAMAASEGAGLFILYNELEVPPSPTAGTVNASFLVKSDLDGNVLWEIQIVPDPATTITDVEACDDLVYSASADIALVSCRVATTPGRDSDIAIYRLAGSTGLVAGATTVTGTQQRDVSAHLVLDPVHSDRVYAGFATLGSTRGQDNVPNEPQGNYDLAAFLDYVDNTKYFITLQWGTFRGEVPVAAAYIPSSQLGGDDTVPTVLFAGAADEDGVDRGFVAGFSVFGHVKDNGTFVWEDKTVRVQDVVSTPQGSYFVLGRLYYEDAEGEEPEVESFVVKFKHFGGPVEWFRVYPELQSAKLRSMAFYEEENLLLIAGTVGNPVPPFRGFGDEDVCLLVIDQMTGTLRDLKMWGTSGEDKRPSLSRVMCTSYAGTMCSAWSVFIAAQTNGNFADPSATPTNPDRKDLFIIKVPLR